MTLGAAALCRLDDRLLERIRRGDDLRGVVLAAIGTIGAGAGGYGFAFGIWRGPEQAAYSAIKLPALLLSVALCTVGLGGMFAILLRSRLSLRQTAVCMLLSFAVASAVLGSIAPVAIALDLLVPPSDPGPAALAASLRVGHALLLVHTAVVAGAGIAGVLRLRTLLAKLGLDPGVLRRVLVSWLSAQFLVGSQLSWLFRPFFGEPRVRVTFFAAQALHGSFFDAVAGLMRSTFGPEAPLLFAILATGTAVMLGGMLYPDLDEVSLDLGSGGLAVKGPRARTVRWCEIASVRADGAGITIELVEDEALRRERLRVGCASREAASALARQIGEAAERVEGGAFRTAG